ncbi:rubredoxin-like domain-containing protein [Thermodesulfobacteriota bacterium]
MDITVKATDNKLLCKKTNMTPNIEKILISAFSFLSKASARKKVYSRKALKEGREDLSHLLRTISESESVQARRLFNSLRGQIDNSDQYISTIFEKEIEDIIGEYSAGLSEIEKEKNKALKQALFQLRAAEKRTLSFYSKNKKDTKDGKKKKYFVCQFCGFINVENPPETCPICGATQKGFREIL